MSDPDEKGHIYYWSHIWVVTCHHSIKNKAYMRSLRGFLVELGLLADRSEREMELLKRRQEIADMAHEIRPAMARSVGRSVGSWSMGLAGSAWSGATGDVFGAAVGALGLVPGLIPDRKDVVGAYSYLFAVTSAFGRASES